MIQFGLPVLHGWLASAAGILPLSAFISFIDSSTDVHLFDLCGSLSLCAWAMTPRGARLLFATLADPAATFGGCFLDRPENTMPVNCIDGRWGDHYPASSPYTLRLCVSACNSIAKMLTPQARSALAPTARIIEGRPLTLEVIRLRLLPAEREPLFQSTFGQHVPRWCKLKVFHWPYSLVHKNFAQQQPRWRVVSLSCWLAWVALIIISITTHQNIAVAYLFTIVATGVVIRFADAHHAGPRRLIDTRDEAHPRLVVASNNMNAVRWTAFLGGHKLIDSLLNRFTPHPLPPSWTGKAGHQSGHFCGSWLLDNGPSLLLHAQCITGMLYWSARGSPFAHVAHHSIPRNTLPVSGSAWMGCTSRKRRWQWGIDEWCWVRWWHWTQTKALWIRTRVNGLTLFWPLRMTERIGNGSCTMSCSKVSVPATRVPIETNFLEKCWLSWPIRQILGTCRWAEILVPVYLGRFTSSRHGCVCPLDYLWLGLLESNDYKYALHSTRPTRAVSPEYMITLEAGR